MGLAGTVVRILAEDHHLNRVERCVVEGGKHQPPRRVNLLARGPLGHKELPKRCHARHFELRRQPRLP